MDFRFTPEEEAFRQEIIDFAKKELPDDWVSLGLSLDPGEEGWDFHMTMAKKLAQKHWLTLHWPKEYGGADAPPIQNMIFRDEASYWGIPGWMMGASGTGWVGPSLMLFGTEEQKKKYLPPIAAGEADGVWNTGYSEPDAGTDLANIKTRAVKVGDEYIINGEKTWQSLAHYARYNWCLCKTDPDLKHRGMSLIIVDLKSPGITIKPIIDIAGNHMVNQIFYDDVHVPVTNLVGEENRGWYCVMQALAYERGAIANPGSSRRYLDLMTEYAQETKRGGQPLSKNPAIRNKLAEMALDTEFIKLMCYKIAWSENFGPVSAPDASMIKIFSTESSIRTIVAAMEILGPYAQLRKGSKWARLYGALQSAYLTSFIARFGGGTNEIQRNIIAWMGLGIPRE